MRNERSNDFWFTGCTKGFLSSWIRDIIETRLQTPELIVNPNDLDSFDGLWFALEGYGEDEN